MNKAYGIGYQLFLVSFKKDKKFAIPDFYW